MKTDLLQTFTRLTPSVLAVQVVPGIEDNWVATGPNGEELSRGSTIETVQRAAPNAQDYAPILELPGLEGKPLKMGDYVINDGDGVYWIMAKDDFEDQFAEESDDGKKSKKPIHAKGKAEPETVDYKGEQLSIAELMQLLQARDEELEKLREIDPPEGSTDPDAATEIGENFSGQLPLDPGQEPIFVVEHDATLLVEGNDMEDWVQNASAQSDALGAPFKRVTLSDDKTKILLEGWVQQPDDQGPVRWGQPINPTSASAGDNEAKEHEHDANGKKGGAKKPTSKKPATKKPAAG